jgi:hypothetical protein
LPAVIAALAGFSTSGSACFNTGTNGLGALPVLVTLSAAAIVGVALGLKFVSEHRAGNINIVRDLERD